MAYPASSGPVKATAPIDGDDSFNTLFNNLNDAWTTFQIDASATMFGVTRNILDSDIMTDFTILNEQLQQTMKEAYHQLVQDSADTIYSSAQTSSDLLHAVLAPALQPAPTPSPLDLRVVDPDHWPISTYLIAKMIDPAYNDHVTHAYVDPCNLSQYDLGWFYGLFFADEFLQSSHAPACLPRTDTSVNFWHAPHQFITNIMTNDHEQEFYDTFLPMTELKEATSQFGADQLDSFLQWFYNDLSTVVTHWLFNKIESTKQRLIQFGWPLLTTLGEYCSGLATAMIESFGKAQDGLVAFLRDWYMKMTEYSCGVITTLVKVWDQAVVSIRRWITTMRMDKYGSHRAADTVVNGGGSPTMSPDDRQETNVKQVLDAVKRGGWYVHYHVLGIDSWTATPDQIKKAFNKRALWVHPDLNSAHGTHEAMRAVNAAHKALSSSGHGIATAFVVVILAAALVALVYYKRVKLNKTATEPTTRSNQGHGGNGSPPTRLLYTPKQAAAVKEVLDIVNGRGSVFAKHCRVLGIRKAATPAEIKKAYHKRSLQVHDDRNKAPGASEAMKAVNEARDVCTDYAEHRTTVTAANGLTVVQYALVLVATAIAGLISGIVAARFSA
jgi:DnaJ domain